MILFTASVEGFTIMPKVRMTQGSKWSPRAKQYLKSQSDLAMLLKAQYKRKTPISEPCILSYAVHLPHKRRVDDDNVRKALQDSLQHAGIILDDYLIRGTDKTRLYQDGEARVVVVLKSLEDSSPSAWATAQSASNAGK